MSTFIGMGVKKENDTTKETKSLLKKVADLEKEVATVTMAKETAEAKVANLEKEIATLKKSSKEDK